MDTKNEMKLDAPAETSDGRRCAVDALFGWTTRKYPVGPYLLLHPARPSRNFAERIKECLRLTLRCLWQNFNGCQWSMPTLRVYVAILRGKILINS